MEKAGRKVAIVTGAASGIGKAIAKQLAGRGVDVVIADIDEVRGRQTVEEIAQAGGAARFLKLDVTDYAEVEAAVYEAYHEYGRLDYMFNNAGISLYAELYDMTEAHWRRIVDVNVWGVINGVQAAYPIMKKQGFGHIANTSSATALGPAPTAAAYATTKHAVLGLTTSLHYEAEAFGVKVSALCPSFVDTPIFAASQGINMDTAKVQAQMAKQKKMSPEQFAALALRDLERNRPIVCPMPLRRTMDVFFALFPAAHRSLMRLVCQVSRQARVEPGEVTKSSERAV
ncbi:SDR family NAD(P)-dependent oxidoreductase [Saccharibacillus sacchari]|uniref:SDR family NAD(P)-dependent oxidoreductase n=1 Tax=Saccharibacillus sacchari TaxID=456493 RepID=UPI0004B1F21D|nr:SDR family oxidoreductase [Saccharibacillus sacchari]